MQLFLFTVSIPPGTHISPKCIIIYNARNIGVFVLFLGGGCTSRLKIKIIINICIMLGLLHV